MENKIAQGGVAKPLQDLEYRSTTAKAICTENGVTDLEDNNVPRRNKRSNDGGNFTGDREKRREGETGRYIYLKRAGVLGEPRGRAG